MAETRDFIATNEARPPFFVGIDLGGTNIKVGVVDDSGRPLSWLSIPTQADSTPDDGAGAWPTPSSAPMARPG